MSEIENPAEAQQDDERLSPEGWLSELIDACPHEQPTSKTEIAVAVLPVVLRALAARPSADTATRRQAELERLLLVERDARDRDQAALLRVRELAGKLDAERAEASRDGFDIFADHLTGTTARIRAALAGNQ